MLAIMVTIAVSGFLAGTVVGIAVVAFGFVAASSSESVVRRLPALRL